MIARALLVLAGVVTLAGCATPPPVYEGGRAHEDGWRRGRVERIGSALELGRRLPHDCRYADGLGVSAGGGRFAVIGSVNAGTHRHDVVPVEPSREPAVGEAVLVNKRSCEPPVARNGK